ncbi:MAG: putative DNA-binding domain-containing protein [Kofleriaceae bacterium]
MSLLWRAARNDVPNDELTPFRSSGRLAVPAAISLYRNGYWIRQYRVLCELFPRLHQRLGPNAFRELVRVYLGCWPSSHPELERIGTALPGFMRNHPDPSISSLTAIATMEQALTESALSIDSPVASVADIVPEQFGESRLVFVESLRVVALDQVVIELLASEGHDVATANAVVITRPDFATVLQFIDRDETNLLQLARAGTSISELLQRCEHDVARMHAWLHRWFARRWLARVAVKSS